MGIGRSKHDKAPKPITNFCPLRIASLYVDLGESINKRKKIRAIINYFMNDYYGYEVDVLCLQGIKSYNILKEIVKEFKIHIEKYNDKYARDGNDLYLSYFPDIDIKKEKNDMNWSTGETEETDYYDKLIITRHEILSTAITTIGAQYGFDNVDSNMKFHGDNLAQAYENILSNGDSDKVYDGKRQMQIVNLNVDGTYVSIYNVELKSDIKGIKSSKERRNQLFHIKEIVNNNAENSKDATIREFLRGDETFIAHDRNIHIVTGMFHINEMKNNDVNHEYSRMIKILDGLDTHRWNMVFRNRYKSEYTNIKFSKNSYIFLISEPLIDVNDLQGQLKRIYQNHKTLVTNSSIMKNSVDMNYFTNYPIDVLFMIYKPKIGIVISKNKTKSSNFIKKEMMNRSMMNFDVQSDHGDHGDGVRVGVRDNNNDNDGVGDINIHGNINNNNDERQKVICRVISTRSGVANNKNNYKGNNDDKEKRYNRSRSSILSHDTNIMIERFEPEQSESSPGFGSGSGPGPGLVNYRNTKMNSSPALIKNFSDDKKRQILQSSRMFDGSCMLSSSSEIKFDADLKVEFDELQMNDNYSNSSNNTNNTNNSSQLGSQSGQINHDQKIRKNERKRILENSDVEANKEIFRMINED